MDSKDIKNLNKILEHALSIVNETKDIKTSQDFIDNNNVSKAALFDLLQIGELSNKLSKEYILCSSIPWVEIYNLRNRIVHGYADVDYEIIWSTITDDVPVLIKGINKVISK